MPLKEVIYMEWINILPTRAADGRYKSGIRVYWQISNAARAHWPSDRIECDSCESEWRLETCVCLTCWVPMTRKAILGMIFAIDDKDAREREVWERFRMTMKEFRGRIFSAQ